MLNEWNIMNLSCFEVPYEIKHGMEEPLQRDFGIYGGNFKLILVMG
jgi:hypothetical protein